MKKRIRRKNKKTKLKKRKILKSRTKARIIRDGVVVYNGEIQSIYREKNQVKEVGTGLECGISIKDFIDFKEKDVIEVYKIVETERRI